MNSICVIAILVGFNTVMILCLFFYNSRRLNNCAKSFKALERFSDYVSCNNRMIERRAIELQGEMDRQFCELLWHTKTINAKIGFVAKREVERWKKENHG